VDRSARSDRLTLAVILVLAAALRMVQISNPVLGHHSWRQADTAAMARNFVSEEFDFLHPRVDWRGVTTGDVECELPIYPFLCAILYKMFGIHMAIPRALSILFSLLTLLVLYALVRDVSGERTAAWSAFFFAILPMPAFFGRAVMPESLLLLGMAGGLYGFWVWFQRGPLRALALGTLGLAVACLIKPPSLYLGLPVLYLAAQRHGRRCLRRPELWAAAVMILAGMILWFGHAHHLKSETGLTFGIWEYGSDKWGNWDLLRTGSFWSRIFLYRLPKYYLAWFGAPILALGLVARRERPVEAVFWFWFGSMAALILVVGKGTYIHDYYLLPASLPCAYFLGRVYAGHFRRGRPRWRIGLLGLCLVGMSVVSLAILTSFYQKERPGTSAVFRLAQAVQVGVPPGALIAAVDQGNPTLLYLADRKGWHVNAAELDPAGLHALHEAGAGYLAGLREDFRKQGRESFLASLLADEKDVRALTEEYFILALP
jgi:4-amino-4-deoxy-L-arabinose transferase-like glycosyltransferase